MTMQMIAKSYRSLSLVFQLSADRLMVACALVLSLAAAAGIGMELLLLDLPNGSTFH